MFKVDDRIREISVTAGAGTYTLGGTVAGFRPFSTLGANNYTRYFATDGVDSEWGIGRFITAPDRLERTTIHGSTNGGAAVVWGAGTRTIRCGSIASMDMPRVLSKDVAGGAGTTVLTQDEQRRAILTFTGALTGNRVIEVDDTPWPWIIYNNTTGGFSLTFKVTAQTGIVLVQGKRTVAYCDGVDVRAGAAGAASSTSEFVASTAMLFHQTTAPIGWTKETGAGYNDAALRFVTGTVSTGGADAFSAHFGTGKFTQGHALTIAELASHEHEGDGRIDVAGGATGTCMSTSQHGASTGVNTAHTGSSAAHAHNLSSFNIKYVDVIIARKD